MIARSFTSSRPDCPSQLSDLLLISLILVGVYLSWNMFFFLRREQHWKRVSLAPYFALLGAAFMLVEIPLIQRFSLLLGQPVLALVIVIGALLIGGGLGSLFESRYPVAQSAATGRRLRRVIVGLAVLAGTRVILPALIDWALPSSLVVRVIVTVAALLPLGFVMGMPFPGGLRVAHEADPQGVAAFWGANAVASVLGSALAMTLAIRQRIFGGAAARRGAVCAGGDDEFCDLAAAGVISRQTSTWDADHLHDAERRKLDSSCFPLPGLAGERAG